MVSFFFSCLLVYFLSVYVFFCSFDFKSFRSSLKTSFCVDSVSVYLTFLTFVLSLCSLFLIPWLSREEVFFVFFSQIFAILSYICVKLFFFWVFYEMSMVLLLYLLLKRSPYSERYSAFWYLLCYLSVSSMPMFFVVCYFMFFGLCHQSSADVNYGVKESEAIFLLGILFITKMPLFPFTAWLPVVHAEASSMVSVCLSGYMMKLGLLGLMRFCLKVFPDSEVFLTYTGFILFFGVLCFCYSSSELDKKRWLAFLSIAHMVIAPLCLFVSAAFDYEISLSYCLGHALSAGVSFMIFWFLSSVAGSRCWLVSKHAFSGSMIFVFSLGLALCFCGSLPFTLQFFCEAYAVCGSASYSVFLFVLTIFYLFFSALVPLVCLGYFLTRHRDVRVFSYFSVGPYQVMVFLCFLNFLIFMFF